MRKTVGVNLLAGLFLWALVAKAQAPDLQAPRYDLLLKGGHVIDPANGLDAKMDVGVSSGRIGQAVGAIEALGLSTSTNAIRAGLVACTGNMGCKFAASDTKRHAEEIAHWCETRVALDGPINIHLTGCHHSCAQHYVGDIGLLACKVQETEESEQIEGYHILVGGGFGPDAALAREIYRDVKAVDVPATVERLLKAYLAGRASKDESFLAFTRRHDDAAIKQMTDQELVS